MKFRLTTGENGTAFGKQYVVISENADNAIDFLNACLDYARASMSDQDALAFLDNCWIDAGSDTLPIAVQNIDF